MQPVEGEPYDITYASLVDLVVCWVGRGDGCEFVGLVGSAVRSA